jgi:hypothetical protein
MSCPRDADPQAISDKNGRGGTILTIETLLGVF